MCHVLPCRHCARKGSTSYLISIDQDWAGAPLKWAALVTRPNKDLEAYLSNIPYREACCLDQVAASACLNPLSNAWCRWIEVGLRVHSGCCCTQGCCPCWCWNVLSRWTRSTRCCRCWPILCRWWRWGRLQRLLLLLIARGPALISRFLLLIDGPIWCSRSTVVSCTRTKERRVSTKTQIAWMLATFYTMSVEVFACPTRVILHVPVWAIESFILSMDSKIELLDPLHILIILLSTVPAGVLVDWVFLRFGL